MWFAPLRASWARRGTLAHAPHTPGAHKPGAIQAAHGQERPLSNRKPHLVDQLSGGCHAQRHGAIPLCQRRLVLHVPQHGQHKRKRLAAACLGNADAVAPAHDDCSGARAVARESRVSWEGGRKSHGSSGTDATAPAHDDCGRAGQAWWAGQLACRPGAGSGARNGCGGAAVLSRCANDTTRQLPPAAPPARAQPLQPSSPGSACAWMDSGRSKPPFFKTSRMRELRPHCNHT